MQLVVNQVLNIKIPNGIAIIGIDSGSQGAFVLFAGDKKIYKKMPKKEGQCTGIHGILKEMKKIAIEETGMSPFVVLEKVSGMKQSKGGNYTDGKLMQNFGRIEMAIDVLNLKSVQIASVTWKSNFGLKLQDWQKDFSVTQKKDITINWLNTQLKDFKYPEHYIKQIGDAAAIAYWGQRIFEGKQYNVSRKIRMEIRGILLEEKKTFIF